MIRRREVITLLGGAAAVWPMKARGQKPRLPVVGFLSGGSPEPYEHIVVAFREGMREVGYVEGRNVAIEYRWAEGEYDRLTDMATDLVRRQMAVIVASGGTRPILAAKAATTTIPIVFLTASDPAAAGFVASLNRPGGNVTGVNFLVGELATKQLGLLRELVPTATMIALLVNPHTPAADPIVSDVQMAARTLGLQLKVLKAGTNRDVDDVFASFGQRSADALLVQVEPFLSGLRGQIVSMAARYAIPVIAGQREFAAAGGLMSYGSSIPDAYRLAGTYTGRILKGEKPSDLPIVQPTRFELVINLRTARALSLEIPAKLLALADEVIE